MHFPIMIFCVGLSQKINKCYILIVTRENVYFFMYKCTLQFHIVLNHFKFTSTVRARKVFGSHKLFKLSQLKIWSWSFLSWLNFNCERMYFFLKYRISHCIYFFKIYLCNENRYSAPTNKKEFCPSQTCYFFQMLFYSPLVPSINDTSLNLLPL